MSLENELDEVLPEVGRARRRASLVAKRVGAGQKDPARDEEAAVGAR